MNTTDHHRYEQVRQDTSVQDAARAAQIERIEEQQREAQFSAVPRTVGLGALAITSFAAFLWFGSRADLLPPDGAGSEVTMLHDYGGAAVLTFSLALLAWAGTLVSAWYAREPFRQRALTIFGAFMPLAFYVAHFSSAR